MYFVGFKKATEIERKKLVLNLVKNGYMDVKKAASLIGKLGSAKGGRVRAERLSPERRSEIARKAAQARWRKWRAASTNPIR